MCGISGIFNRKNGKINTEDINRMLSVIRHRGPDEAGFCILNGGSAILGHVRLSIIDLETGGQPMYNEEKSISISFNGEIYDYRRLRDELIKKGHVFSTHSDTEVIIHLYEEYGTKCLNMLNGEFAFILWDESKKTLLAARDIAGIKPLFYHENSNEIILSSECKAILCLNRINKEISPEYLSGAFMANLPPATSAFREIRSLSPGHFLISQNGEKAREISYWKPDFTVDSNLSFEDAKDGVRHYLRKAVSRRMIADVPVGAYLSGGLDSGLICSLMAEDGNRFTAFNIGFGSSAYDESSDARSNAEVFGIPFDSISLDMNKMADVFKKTIYHTELAIIDPHAMAKHMLSSHVRSQKYKVCITGEGADEIFAGYPYFKMELIRQMINQGGNTAKDGKNLWKTFLDQEKRSERILWDRKKAFLIKNDHLGFPSYTFARAREMTSFFSKILNPEVLGTDPMLDFPGHFKKFYPVGELRSLHPTNASRAMSFHQLSSYVIPVLGDRAEMANSVECRTPFLDKDLIEFATKLPPEHLIDIKTMKEKYVLKEAFSDSLPAKMKNIRKHPFLTPGWSEFFGTTIGREYADYYLSDRGIKESGLMRPEKIRRIKRIMRYIPDNSRFKMRLHMLMGYLLSLQMLHDIFIQNTIEFNPFFPVTNKTTTFRKTKAA